MSFLGSMGNLMACSDLQELLEVVYAGNTLTHMTTGKAVSRAIHGHLLVDAALSSTLPADVYNVPVPTKDAVGAQTCDDMWRWNKRKRNNWQWHHRFDRSKRAKTVVMIREKRISHAYLQLIKGEQSNYRLDDTHVYQLMSFQWNFARASLFWGAIFGVKSVQSRK